MTNALDEIGRALKAKRITLEEMIKRGREIRGTWIEKEYGLKEQTTRKTLKGYGPRTK